MPPNFLSDHTPEALLGRNDSRDSATTCHGITSSGRPCRRAGKVTPSNYYCWQHKDQAPANMATVQLKAVKERGSLDTMMQKLGVESAPRAATSKPKNSRPRALYTRPLHGPPLRIKKNSLLEDLCCMTGVRYYNDPPMPKTTTARPPAQRPSGRPTSARMPPRKSVSALPKRPAPQHRSASHPKTAELMSLIPPHLSPRTTSAILAELVKPLRANAEDGYIYIFWLTPETKAAPAESTARSLLGPPDETRPRHARRISDVMTEYSYDGGAETTKSPSKGSKPTIMLKIGRASNVTRRMHEWQRQCGYAVTLVRWYPYVPSTISTANTPQQSPQRVVYPDLSQPPPASPRRNDAVRKVRAVKTVERLIHLELAEKQVKRQCTTCGKEHREWFEVEASQMGIREVDECVRRWVSWSEHLTECKTDPMLSVS